MATRKHNALAQAAQSLVAHPPSATIDEMVKSLALTPNQVAAKLAKTPEELAAMVAVNKRRESRSTTGTPVGKSKAAVVNIDQRKKLEGAAVAGAFIVEVGRSQQGRKPFLLDVMRLSPDGRVGLRESLDEFMNYKFRVWHHKTNPKIVIQVNNAAELKAALEPHGGAKNFTSVVADKGMFASIRTQTSEFRRFSEVCDRKGFDQKAVIDTWTKKHGGAPTWENMAYSAIISAARAWEAEKFPGEGTGKGRKPMSIDKKITLLLLRNLTPQQFKKAEAIAKDLADRVHSAKQAAEAIKAANALK